MPKLWNDTIEAHRNAVREATLDTTAALVAEHGLASVTMSQIAKDTGIGRATLYKYFPDVDSILTAWHERQISAHLAQLAEIGEQAGTPRERLQAVLQAFAFIARGNHDTDLAALMHRGGHVVRAQQHLHAFIADLIAEAAKAGELRDDTPPGELATYCLHALTSASSLPSKAAIGRLVSVTLAGLRPGP
ncbi:MAG: TetR/AcrR family transcriptional regulator [Allobranchiibius sp.]